MFVEGGTVVRIVVQLFEITHYYSGMIRCITMSVLDVHM